MIHTCHAHGCDVVVAPKLLMCRRHWYQLSAPMRRAIWREYREGQEVAKNPTARYMAVQRRAIADVASRTQPESVVAEYRRSAETWREKAIRVGLGDPFEGLPDPPKPPQQLALLGGA